MSGVYRFRDLPKNARRYIFLHTIGSPLMIGDYIVLVYLFYTGYSIIGVGSLFTVVNILEIFLPAIIGKFFDKYVSAKLAMSLIYLLEGFAYLIFYFVFGGWGWVFLIIGVFIMKFASVFYPIFPTYEHYVYPEDIREKALIYHLVVPEYVQIIAFPLFGFFLTYIFPQLSAYRNTLLLISGGSFLLVIYIYLSIEDIPHAKTRIEGGKLRISIPHDFLYLFLIEDCLVLADAMLPTLTLTYFVMFILNQSFFILMLLEVTNSAVTIVLGHYLKNREMNKRALLIGGVILFATVHLFYILAVWKMSIIPVVIGIILQTAGNVFWFPVHRTMLFNVIPENKRGSFFGSMSTMFKISTASAPFISALLISLWVYSPFIIAGILYIIAGVGYYYITKSKGKKD